MGKFIDAYKKLNKTAGPIPSLGMTNDDMADRAMIDYSNTYGAQPAQAMKPAPAPTPAPTPAATPKPVWQGHVPQALQTLR